MTDEEKEKESTEEVKEEVKEIPPQDAEKDKAPEKITLTQQELNNQLANARRKAEADYKTLKSDFEDFKKSIEAKEKAANDAALEKVETLRKDLPDSITKLLDKLTAVEQLEWLNDPENVITKKEIPPLPQSAAGHGKQTKTINIV